MCHITQIVNLQKARSPSRIPSQSPPQICIHTGLLVSTHTHTEPSTASLVDADERGNQVGEVAVVLVPEVAVVSQLPPQLLPSVVTWCTNGFTSPLLASFVFVSLQGMGDVYGMDV